MTPGYARPVRTIIHGEQFPGGGPYADALATYARAPDVGVFLVPRRRLVSARELEPFSAAAREGEMLFLGDDLSRYLVGWGKNPF